MVGAAKLALPYLPYHGPAMKLVIQIPCLDEEATLPRVLKELPRQIEGFDLVEWLEARPSGRTASTF